jgi:glucosamine--fructose-6-phosphate aminotransferase (isomerizing)
VSLPDGASTVTSLMRETMSGQADALARLLDDDAAVAPVVERLRGRRVLTLGTGTSWHAANQAAALLRRSGLDADAAQSADVVLGDDGTGRAEVVLAFTHTGPRKRFTAQAIAGARERGLDVVQISGEGIEEADLITVAQERSAAYTASHLGALLRTAQLAVALGAELPALDDVPGAVEDAFRAQRDPVPPPARLIEFTGGGINAWTAAEGALKIREAAYVASEGLGVEQLLHGPSVALRDTDHLVCLDGGGAWSERLEQVADAAERTGTPVTRISATALGEPLSIFPLTVAVQRIALESAEALGTDPDTFGMDIPGRQVWREIGL